MRKTVLGIVTTGTMLALAVSGCGSSKDSSKSAGGGSTSSAAAGKKPGKVGVILPDTQSSIRWESFDRPLLKKAFEDAGITADIQNAQNDKAKFSSIADSMIQEGVQVLILTALDSPSAASVETKAKNAGIKTIDYDRLVLGGSSDYYVSFDNVKVGELQGQGLEKCLGTTKKGARIIMLDGSPDDNNATLFKQGALNILQPKFASGDYVKVGDQAVPGWDNAKGGQIFQQMLTRAGGKVDGVLAANDGLSLAAQTVLQNAGLKGVPATGQDASPAGLQAILRGDQCMTVYKPVQDEAKGASDLAIALIKGEKAQTTGVTKDPTGKRDVPSVLLTPVAIYKNNVNQVITGGLVKKSEVCVGAVAALCAKNGVS